MAKKKQWQAPRRKPVAKEERARRRRQQQDRLLLRPRSDAEIAEMARQLEAERAADPSLPSMLDYDFEEDA